MCEFDWKGLIDLVLATATVALAWKTWNLATATKQMADEARESSLRQIGVQTWLTLEKRFDSREIKLHRQELVDKLRLLGTVATHNDIDETLFELFESIGSLYNRGLIDKQLAESSFSFHAAGWWQLAKKYIDSERKRHNHDDEIFCEFQKFGEAMVVLCPKINLEKFQQDEKLLIR